ncbi:hypothetical protein ACI2OX_05285 [Bacillus sp. N9]
MKRDRELMPLLVHIQATVQKDINELARKRISAEKYANPYAATQQHDGAFYDKRK